MKFQIKQVLILTIYLLNSHFVLLSKNDFKITDKKLISYYQNRNAAEQCITRSEFILANEKYLNAFKFNNPFTSDLINALICSFIAHDEPQFNTCFQKLAERGFDFKSLNTDKDLSKKLSEYDTKLKIKPTYNKKLHKTIDSLMIVDQSLRKLPNGKEIYKDEILKLDLSNGAFLKKLFINHGFPTEDEFGVIHDDLQIILVHQSCLRKERIDLTSDIRKAILSGKLNNKTGAHLLEILACQNKIDYGTSAKLYKVVFFKPKDENHLTQIEKDSIEVLKRNAKLVYPKLDVKIKESLNQKANFLCLDSFDNRMRLAKFQFENKDKFDFNFFTGFDGLVDVLIIYDIKTYKMMQKNMVDLN